MTSSAPDYPEYEFVPATIVANGKTLAKQYKNGDGTVITDISLPQATVDRQNKLQKLMNDYENTINVFSPELSAEFENIANARKQSALQNFESMYEPAVRNAREDYYSRLGTLDSTAYLDRYNALEKTRRQAYADIANDYVANLAELKNNELANRYNYLNYLQNALNSSVGQNDNYLSPINSMAANYTNSYNSYLNNKYNSELSASKNYIGNFANALGRASSFFW